MGALGFGPRSNTALACGAAREMPGWGRQRRRPRRLLWAAALPTLPCGETRAGPEEKSAPRALAESWLSQEDTAKRAEGRRRGWDC